MFLTKTKIVNQFPIERLRASRVVLKSILESLGYSKPVIRKQDYLVNPLGDDTLKREMEMFKLLKETFSKTLKGDRIGNAINSFVINGVHGEIGKWTYSQKELDKLNNKLSKYLGPDIAAQTTNQTLKMIEDQYKISKDLVDRAARKVDREVGKKFSKVDRKTIDIIHKDNNFFISGTYDKTLIGRVNEAVATHVESGLPKNKLAENIKATMEEQLPPRADNYYQVLANDALGRARIFGQVNSYAEARIRKYEILAVLDERTSEICEYMDGMVFETELARKVVKDIQSFGIPENEKQVGEMKALRPWVFFDSEAARSGKNSLYFEDAKGNPIYLPNSGFKETGGIFSLSDKGGVSGADIQALGGANVNAPVLPPYHAHCRSTTIISEEEIRTEDWIEDISIDDLGFGSELTNLMNGEVGEITGITKAPNPIITVKTPTTTTKGPIGEIATQFTPPKITKPKEGKTINDYIPKKPIKETETPNKDRLKDKGIVWTGPRGQEADYRKLFNETLDKLPDGLFKLLEKINIIMGSKALKNGYRLGEHIYNPYIQKSNIKVFLKIPIKYRTTESGQFVAKGKVKETIAHEVGHGFWRNITDIQIPGEIKSKWNIYHRDVMQIIDVKPEVKIVSYYSRTNSEEHFCEAFTNWINNKELFKELEPNAYDFFTNNIDPLLKGKK